MPRGVPKSGSSSSVGSTIMTAAPPSSRVVSARSAKVRANASILERDSDIDALIRKHDKKGARGFAKSTRKTQKQQDDQDEQQQQQQQQQPGATTIDESVVDITKRKRKMTTKALSSQDDLIKDESSSPPKTRAKGKSTRKAKAAPPTLSDPVIDNEQPKISPVPSSPSKKEVLKESRRDHNKQNAGHLDPDQDAQDKQGGPSSSSSPMRVAASSSERPNLLSSPVRRRPIALSPKKQRRTMPDIQIASFLENYDLEAENRLRIARKTLRISIDSARTQMHAKAVARLPRSVRLMRLGDFVYEYGADVQAAVERSAIVADRARKDAWEEERLQRKRKGADADLNDNRIAGDDAAAQEGGKGKTARIDGDEKKTTTAAASRSKQGSSSTQAKRSAKAKKAVHKPNALPALPSSPPLASTPPHRYTSKIKPPSSATFTPHLKMNETNSSDAGVPAVTPANGKARAAQAGEQIQWMSLSGSPIIGIIAPDGTVHAMPRTLRKTPSKPSKSANWQAIDADGSDDEDDDAETSATQLLELARGIDGNRRTRATDASARHLPQKNSGAATIAEEVSPISRASLHTAQASRRATLDDVGDSDEEESVFEEARSRPGDSEEVSLMRDGDESSLPDEEAYMAQVMREEEEKRARMLASEPRMARSSASSRLFGARSSGDSSVGTSNGGGGRASHSTIRALPNGSLQQHKGRSSVQATARSSNAGGGSGSSSMARPPASPMVRNKASGSTRLASSSSSAGSASSSPGKGRVSIVFGSGSRHRMTNFSVDDLMRLPSHERNQMIDILEKLKQAQSSSAAPSSS